jgi:hypothetical protein
MPYKNKKDLYEAQKRYRVRRGNPREQAMRKALGLPNIQRAIRESNKLTQSQKQLLEPWGVKRKGKGKK